MKKWLVLLVSIVFLVTACSSGTPDSTEKQGQPAAKEASPASKEAADNKLSLTNDGIDKTAFETTLKQFPEQKPEKIVTTSIPIAEMLHLLGIQPIGIPNTTHPLPKELDAAQRIGSSMTPDLELIAKLQPNLLLGAESVRSTLEKHLANVKLPASYLRTDSFDDLKLSLKVLGTYFDKKEKMNTILSGILEKENELAKKSEGKKVPKVMLMIGTTDSFMVMNEKSYLGSLVKKLKADNIATSVFKATETYSPMNMENIIAANPDVILMLASGANGTTQEKFDKEVAKNNAWTKLSAYQNKTIHVLDYSIFGVTSIMNVQDALTQISSYLYK